MNPQLELTFILLIVYQVKHFIADFPLQREYMLRKSVPGWDFLLPLLTHCGVHALGTLVIVVFVNPTCWWLALFDFIVHFFTDRIKASPNYLGRYNNLSQSGFWNILGIDQMVHHITHIIIIWWLVTRL